MNNRPNIGDLKVWWKPQIPCESFEFPVATVEEGVKFLQVLADYDIFQYENRIKPDYCNAGGVMIYEENGNDNGDGPGWCDWYDEETGMDAETYVESQKEA